MTRDEEVGVELSGPGEAQAEVPETVEPDDGEGRTVGTALHDDIADVDVADDGAGAPNVAGAASGETGRPDDAADPADAGTVVDREAEDRDDTAVGTEAVDGAAGDGDYAGAVEADEFQPDADSSDEPVSDGPVSDEPVSDEQARAGVVAESVVESVEANSDTAGVDAGQVLPLDLMAVEVTPAPDVAPATDASADAPETEDAAERTDPEEARDGGPEPTALVEPEPTGDAAPEPTGDAAPERTADHDADGDRADGPEPPAAEGPTAAPLPTADAPADAPADANDRAEPDAEQLAADGAGSTTGDEATAAVLPAPRPEPEYEEITASYVVQDAPVEMSPSDLRVDFGAHLEANYQRLVAQLYAITLSADQAHGVVQDAYSRAWRNWSVIGSSADPTGWVRRVAVRTTMRSWRHLLARLGFARATPQVADGLDERTTALLTSLRDLPAAERRSVVLFHMAGLSPGEIAAVEQVSPSTISTRLDRARRVVIGDTSDLLTGVIELPGIVLDDDRGYRHSMSTAAERAGPIDERWERAESWNGGPDGSWLVSEAPPWDAPNSDEWPRSRPDILAGEPWTGGNAAATTDDERTGMIAVAAYGETAGIDPAAANSAAADGVATDGDEQRKDSEDER